MPGRYSLPMRGDAANAVYGGNLKMLVGRARQSAIGPLDRELNAVVDGDAMLVVAGDAVPVLHHKLV